MPAADGQKQSRKKKVAVWVVCHIKFFKSKTKTKGNVSPYDYDYGEGVFCSVTRT